MPSAHKSEADLPQKFGTPGGFEDNLDDFEDAKIVEEDGDEDWKDEDMKLLRK